MEGHLDRGDERVHGYSNGVGLGMNVGLREFFRIAQCREHARILSEYEV
jgi:hypothetical protein